ncbi:hypothetical protein [Nostoc sp.]|uniref:hypothetical protein n=1 Tax=Nostoc sp. TaxID=1180 RepID=UPI002FF6357D
MSIIFLHTSMTASCDGVTPGGNDRKLINLIELENWRCLRRATPTHLQYLALQLMRDAIA